MAFSILDIAKYLTNADILLLVATVTGAIYGIYGIYKKKHKFFFEWNEGEDAVRLGLFFSIIVSAFAGFIPAAWLSKLPDGVDLPTAVIIAVMCATMGPPLAVKILTRFRATLQFAFAHPIDFLLGRWNREDIDKASHTKPVSVMTNRIQEDLKTQVKQYNESRNAFVSLLFRLAQDKPIFDESVAEKIASNLPELPDFEQVEKALQKYKEEYVALQKGDTAKLIHILQKQKLIIDHLEKENEKYRKQTDPRRQLLIKLVTATIGAAAGYVLQLLTVAMG